MSKTKRIEAEGELTKRGRKPTKVVRVDEGNLPFEVVAGFPRGLRRYLGELDFYRRNVLPFAMDNL